ncbi:hypothetical protein D3C84_1113870 [compost metagenome]
MAELVLDRLAVFSGLPARVVDNVSGEFGAVVTTNGECPDRVAAEVESDDDVLKHAVLLTINDWGATIGDEVGEGLSIGC